MSIDELLEENERMDLLRLVTAGSVDDGKSTLIGRLLYESKGIYEDQLDAIEKASKKQGSAGERVDLALLTDGLKAEREQGITIDVAYRYFSTPRRKFIIADSPGHEQYTRNMVTGSSTASLMIILLDASKGVLVQSRRHAFLASLLRIPHLVVAINKMDLVDYNEERFREIAAEFTEFAARLELTDLTFIPVSALEGDNVTHPSEKMDWYKGRNLLSHLETVHIASDRNLIDFRFPVQYVSRPNSDFRGYMGNVASGVVRPGDEVLVLPSGVTNTVKEVRDANGLIESGVSSQALTLVLENETDISRGDILVHPQNRPSVDRCFEAMVVWMSDTPMSLDKSYVVKQSTQVVPGRISDLRYRVDVNTLRKIDTESLELNEIGRCAFTLNQPITFDPYRRNPGTGALIIIDRMTNNTVGAAMILGPLQDSDRSNLDSWQSTPHGGYLERQNAAGHVRLEERIEKQGHKPATLLLTGLTGTRKRSIAYALERRLFEEGVNVMVLEGQSMRLGLGRDLGFSVKGRDENLRRVSEMAHLLNESGTLCICSFVAPFADTRAKAKELVGAERFLEVHVDAPIEFCRENDPSGLYAKADIGEIKDFPGVTAPYEAPQSPDCKLDSSEQPVDECVEQLVSLLRTKGIIKAAS